MRLVKSILFVVVCVLCLCVASHRVSEQAHTQGGTLSLVSSTEDTRFISVCPRPRLEPADHFADESDNLD